MSDKLTQLQEAADQLAQRFLSATNVVITQHELIPIDQNDSIPDLKREDTTGPVHYLETDAAAPQEFRQRLQILAQDLVLKEQEIESLISTLPGLENSEREQELLIKELEEELMVAEAQRQEAVREKEEVLLKLDQVVRNIRRD